VTQAADESLHQRIQITGPFHGGDSLLPMANKLENQTWNKFISGININSFAFTMQNNTMDFIRGNLEDIQAFGFN
jgi:hypothetical protein